MNCFFQIINKEDFQSYPLSEDILCPLDLKRFEAMSNLQKKKEFLLGRHFVKAMLENTLGENWEKLELEFSPLDKPFLKSNKMQFNLSHSGKYLGLVVSENNCGIDLQKKEKLMNSAKLWKRIAHPEEQKNYPEPNESRILDSWTKKEALTKCLGGGFSYGFHNISLIPNTKSENIHFEDHKLHIHDIHEYVPDNNYHAYIAVELQEGDTEIQIQEKRIFNNER